MFYKIPFVKQLYLNSISYCLNKVTELISRFFTATGIAKCHCKTRHYGVVKELQIKAK